MFFKNFFSRVKTAEADDDISLVVNTTSNDPLPTTTSSHSQHHHIFNETLSKEIVVTIASFLPLSDLNNFARCDQFLLLLFFNLSTQKVNAISKRKKELWTTLNIESRIVSVKDQYKDDEEEATSFVQQFLWKPLVLHHFPNYSRTVNIKNWMHVMRRRVIHLQQRFPNELPLSKIIPEMQNTLLFPDKYRKNKDRQFIENCEWEYECPLKISAFTVPPNAATGAVFCQVCKENVYEVMTEKEFVSHVEQGHCVALSPYLVKAPKQIYRGRIAYIPTPTQ